MAIAFDNASSKDAGNVSSSTLSHTCTGSGLVLIVGVVADSAAAPTSVTYNGVGMTATVTPGTSNTMWYLVNPATGANNIVVTFAASHYFNIGAMSFTGCNTSSPIGVTGTSSGTTNPAQATLSTTVSNSWLVATLFHNGNSSATAITSNTIGYNIYTTTDNFHGVGVYRSTTTTGSYDVGENMGTPSDSWNIGAIELKPGNSVSTLTAATVAYTLTGNSTLLSKAKTLIAAVGSFILTGLDIALTWTGTHWTTQSKNSSSWNTQSKNTSTFTTQTKNSSIWDNEVKH